MILRHGRKLEVNLLHARRVVSQFLRLIEVLHSSNVAWQEQLILFPMGTNVLSTGLLHDVRISHNQPQIASEGTIQEKSHNSQKNTQHS